MSLIRGYDMPDELYYHEEHSWARVDGSKVTVGMTDFFQKEAGDIVFIDLPDEEDEVLVPRLPPGGCLLLVACPGDICLHAYDRLDPRRFRLAEEGYRAEEIAMGSERYSAHAHIYSGRYEVLDTERPIEQAVLRIVVTMKKSCAGHSASTSPPPILAQIRIRLHSCFRPGR